MAPSRDKTLPTSTFPSTTTEKRLSTPKAISLVVACGLAAVLLAYSVRGIDWRQVVSTARHANGIELAAVMALATGSLFLRSLRWRLLLSAELSVSVASAFWATAAGYFGNNFLPARAGELVRTAMIASRLRLDPAFVLATALSERAADAVALVVFAAAALVALPVRPGWTSAAVKPFAVIGLVGVLSIAVLPRIESAAANVLNLLPLPQRMRQKLASLLEQVLRGIRTFHDARRLFGFLGFTLLIWSSDAVGAVLGAAALGFDMSLPVAFLLLASLGLGSALPSTPGYVGIYQFVAVSVLTPFGFTRTDAVAFILVAQALSYVLIGFWGSLGLLIHRRSSQAINIALAEHEEGSGTQPEKQRRNSEHGY
jgi:uncharacterized protein (TIRG00374 family)